MKNNSRLHALHSDVLVTAGRIGTKPIKQPELNGEFIDAISVCNCSHSSKRSSNLITSNLSLEYQAKLSLLGNLPDDCLSTSPVGNCCVKHVTQLKHKERMKDVYND